MNPQEIFEYFQKNEQNNVTKENASDIRAMSCNVLISYATKSANYSFSWIKRGMVLSGCFLHFRPDFLGLQECDAGMLSVITQQIGEVYGMADPVVPDIRNIYSCYTWNHTPVFYDRSKWILKFCKWDAIDDFCWSYTWGFYQSIRDPGREVIHFNFHPTPWGGERLAKNMAKVNEELKRLRMSYPNVPIFATGDYNCKREWEQFDIVIDGVNMESSCLLAKAGDDGLNYTHSNLGEMPTMKNGNSIDHICVTRDQVDVNLYRVICDEMLVQASDHSPIFIDACIKPN